MKFQYIAYMAAWGTLCALALIIYIKDKKSFGFSSNRYLGFLLIKWKVWTFLCATTGITLIAPYTGDPTWDYVDALLMSILTFISAPWSIGALHLVARRRLPFKQAIVAFCAWMFSASWSYDLYLVLRDHQYPLTWFSNIFASSVLYVAAGLLWNLEWRPGRGVTFSFLEPEWPAPLAEPGFTRILGYATPFMLLALLAIGSFVTPSFHSR
ncbi:hypothetical protein [Ralstonia solanacearum]|uniref:Uncharacterized protein n=1 Tax=Ralstonia solanacearum TaxID=305 RepID=A0AAE3NGQ9_RALSL|nr:hypothetical protein [Ralstonia solanacearum]MBB6584965.1 hypothetical protein [Ralstonia solanacearum]MDB0520684.1 hypothetical protein [Ralstonia solanacearum]